jgi:DNA-binding XRE family transcriptional regulator
MKTLKDKLQTLPASRRRKIARRTNLLIAQEMTMRELRKARNITQVEMAKALGVKQEQVSRIEKRTDLHLSTLKRSVEALGGELILTAKFPDGAPVRLTGFAELA